MLKTLLSNINTLFPYLVIAVCVLALICIVSLILLIVTMVKLNEMKKNYRTFMNGKTAENLEDSILDHFSKIDKLVKESNQHAKDIEDINEEIKNHYSKTGIIKYDAFNEMGGKLSFSLAVLDQKNNGYIINAMHSREGCYTYIKEIIKGESFITLAEEEKQALDKAMGIEV